MLSLDIPAEVNAAEWIVDRNVVEGRRDRTAIYFEGDTWTFGDFQALVNRTGNVLRELGVEIENRVGLLMLDTPEYLAAFMGAVKIGAVPICLNTLLGAGAHEYMLNDSRAKAVIAHDEVLGNLLRSMYIPLGSGAATVLNPRRPVPEEMFQVIDRHRPTIFAAVPTMYVAMLQIPDAARTYDLDSLRMCWRGGEALPPAIYREWYDRFGLEILEMLGSSELIHAFCTTRPGMNRPGSIGIPVSGYELRVVDEALRDISDGRPGRLMIAGPTVFAGYANRRERNQETFWGKWMLSADTVRRDAEGIYWFVGRADDMLKVGGALVSPIEIENVLVEHPAVLEAAVVGTPDEHGLIKPKAFLVLKKGRAPSPQLEAELTTMVKEQLACYKYPRWYVYVD